MVVLDKTGTVTKGQPAVTDVITDNEFDATNLLRLAASVEKGSEHPLGESIWVDAANKGIALSELSAFQAEAGHGVQAQVEGHQVVVGNLRMMSARNFSINGLGKNVEQLQAEAKTAMLGAKGSAFLYARCDVQDLIEPLVVSWGWQSETPSESRFIDEQEWQGTRDIAAYLSVPAAIEFMHAHDWRRVRAECHKLAQHARQRISAITGLEPLSPDAPEWYAQMVSLPLPPCDPKHLKQQLYDEYHIEVPIITWNGRQLVRVSIQAYNTREDVDALANALAALLPLVRAM
jgi:hypothetical protein